MGASKFSTIKWISVGAILGIIIFLLVVLVIFPEDRNVSEFPLSEFESLPESQFIPEAEFIEIKSVEYSQHIVPVFAKFCDELGSYTVAWVLENLSNNVLNIRLISQVPQYSQPKIDEIQLNPGEIKLVEQCITFDEFKLKNITEKTKASLEFKAEIDGKRIYEESDSVWIHAWDDMIWSLYEPMDTAGLIAAWVTPRNPSVREVLSKAKEKIVDRSLMGCQSGMDENRMKEELKAIYDTLCFDYGISYISMTVSYAPGFSQKVSLPRETLKHKSANCIDASVLFASLGEALDFHPEIVLIPGHAFVCLDCQYAGRYCIETTLMKDCGTFLFFQVSSFDSAVEEGKKIWDEHFYGRPFCRPDENTCIVSIKEVRKEGITPLE